MFTQDQYFQLQALKNENKRLSAEISLLQIHRNHILKVISDLEKVSLKKAN